MKQSSARLLRLANSANTHLCTSMQHLQTYTTNDSNRTHSGDSNTPPEWRRPWKREEEEKEKRKRRDGAMGDGRRTNARGRRKSGGRRVFGGCCHRSRAWVEWWPHYFLHVLGHSRGTHGRSGGSRRCAVVAVFMQMLYLAIQSSYGRSDSGFEHYARGGMRRRGGDE